MKAELILTQPPVDEPAEEGTEQVPDKIDETETEEEEEEEEI